MDDTPSWAELYLTIHSNLPKFYELLIDGKTEQAFDCLRTAEVAMNRLTSIARNNGLAVGGVVKVMRPGP